MGFTVKRVDWIEFERQVEIHKVMSRNWDWKIDPINFKYTLSRSSQTVQIPKLWGIVQQIVSVFFSCFFVFFVSLYFSIEKLWKGCCCAEVFLRIQMICITSLKCKVEGREEKSPTHPPPLLTKVGRKVRSIQYLRTISLAYRTLSYHSHRGWQNVEVGTKGEEETTIHVRLFLLN